MCSQRVQQASTRVAKNSLITHEFISFSNNVSNTLNNLFSISQKLFKTWNQNQDGPVVPMQCGSSTVLMYSCSQVHIRQRANIQKMEIGAVVLKKIAAWGSDPYLPQTSLTRKKKCRTVQYDNMEPKIDGTTIL